MFWSLRCIGTMSESKLAPGVAGIDDAADLIGSKKRVDRKAKLACAQLPCDIATADLFEFELAHRGLIRHRDWIMFSRLDSPGPQVRRQFLLAKPRRADREQVPDTSPNLATFQGARPRDWKSPLNIARRQFSACLSPSVLAAKAPFAKWLRALRRAGYCIQRSHAGTWRLGHNRVTFWP